MALTPNKRAYNALVAKFKRKAARIAKRGYEFTDEEIQELKLPPSGRVTKQRLAKIESLLKGDNIYKYFEYIIPETGEIVSAHEGRKYERVKAARKGAETKRLKSQNKSNIIDRGYADVLIDNLIEEIRYIYRGSKVALYGERAINRLGDLINTYGKDIVSKAIQDMPYSLKDYLGNNGFGYSMGLEYIEQIYNFITGNKIEIGPNFGEYDDYIMNAEMG